MCGCVSVAISPWSNMVWGHMMECEWGRQAAAFVLFLWFLYDSRHPHMFSLARGWHQLYNPSLKLVLLFLIPMATRRLPAGCTHIFQPEPVSYCNWQKPSSSDRLYSDVSPEKGVHRHAVKVKNVRFTREWTEAPTGWLTCGCLDTTPQWFSEEIRFWKKEKKIRSNLLNQSFCWCELSKPWPANHSENQRY